MEKNKKLLLIIGICVIVILCIIILLCILNLRDIDKKNDIKSNAYKNTDITTNVNNTNDIIYDTNELEEVKDFSMFYTVSNCVQTYLNNVSTAKYTGTSIVSQEENNMTEEQKKSRIMNMLDKEYINKNSITLDNIQEYINTYDSFMTFYPIDMKFIKGEKIDMYNVCGFLKSKDGNNSTDTIYMTVKIDKNNKTFSITPVLKSINGIENMDNQFIDKKIEINSNNEYVYNSMTDEDIVSKYISIYKTYSFANPSILYEHIDQQYRDKRFGSLEEFEKYITKNKEEITHSFLNKYQVNNRSDYTEYVGIDDNGNMYIIEAKSVMDFTLKLDTYTLESEKFTTEYNKVDDQHKVMMNIDKWVQMLNNRDYKAAYEVLDKTFREDNFGTVDDFEEYMRTIYPYFYDLEFGELEEEEGLYIQQITLKNKNDVTDIGREQHIIMQLEQGTTNFVMSFRRVNR